jgi:hypothetical protein
MLQDAANKYAYTLETWDGEKETGFYRLPSLRGMGEYLAYQQDDSTLLAWLCGFKDKDGKLDVDRTDKFTDDSIFALLEEVKELMDPRLAAWISRQAAKNDRIRALNESVQATSGKTSQQTSTSKQDRDLSKFSISPSPSASES